MNSFQFKIKNMLKKMKFTLFDKKRKFHQRSPSFQIREDQRLKNKIIKQEILNLLWQMVTS